MLTFLATVFYALVGIVIAGAAYRAYDILTPFDLSHELAEDQNIAVGLVVAAIFIGVSIIVAAAIMPEPTIVVPR